MNHTSANGLITFFYYDNLERAAQFYEEIMGFELTIDQGWAKIFKVAENAFMGCVDGDIGYHKPSPDKPVMLTVIANDPDAWYQHFKKHGIETLNTPQDNDELNVRMFLLKDPEGYIIEIQKFY
jgi:predicted enzyme related to lactoylglutathione lyase